MKRIRLLSFLLLLAPGVVRAGTLGADGQPPVFPAAHLLRDDLLAQIGGVGSPKKPKEPKELEKPEKKGGVNPRKAMLYSMIIPGLGQQISGHPERARVFYGAEAAIWTSFVAFRLQGDARKDRYIEFAEFTAGVDGSNRDDSFWRQIASYERSDPGPGSANEVVRRQARALYPGDRDAQEAYFQEHGYFGKDAWDWKSVENMQRFRDLRGRSLDSYDNSRISIAVAIAHRIVSMIDAARVARSGSDEKPVDTGSLAPHGQFGVKMMKDGDSRVPLLTYKLKF